MKFHTLQIGLNNVEAIFHGNEAILCVFVLSLSLSLSPSLSPL